MKWEADKTSDQIDGGIVHEEHFVGRQSAMTIFPDEYEKNRIRGDSKKTHHS